MHDVPVFAVRAAHVLFQAAAEGDVDDLQPAADREQGQARVQGLPGDFEVEGVLEVVDVVHAVMGVGRAVAVRGEVTAAREQDAVEAGKAAAATSAPAGSAGWMVTGSPPARHTASTSARALTSAA